MKASNGVLAIGLLFSVSAMYAQDYQRRAAIRGGDPMRGKCTIEVVVDVVAEVEIRGDSANLRTLGGQPAQWRRFECSAPMPPNPYNFRFAGVDGRGRQQLVRPAANGQPAVIRIEDPKSGAEGYTFDIFWENGGRDGDVRRDDRRDDRGGEIDRRPPFVSDDAVRMCQDAARRQAIDRFRTDRVEIRRIGMDSAPDRREWVVGVLTVRDRDREEARPFRFACSVDFRERRMRSVDLNPIDRDRDRDWDRR